MAADRGRFFMSLRQGLERVQQTKCSDAQGEVMMENIAMFQSTSTGRCKSDTTAMRPPEPCKTGVVPKLGHQGSHENYIQKLPAEIILKILSFLDTSSLFSISFVNKQFHDLASNNEFEKKKWRPMGMMTNALSTTSVQEKPAGYWKKMLLREMAGYRDTTWKRELKHLNPHTGMPAQTEQILRRLHIKWEITLTYKTGQENVYEQTHTFFEDMSVIVCWNRGLWPYFYHVSALKIHGIMCSSLAAPGDRPRWRSLISKTGLGRSVQWSILGADKRVKLLQFDKRIIIGIWRGSWRVAFIMANLHFHKLIERSILGSMFCIFVHINSPYMPTEEVAVDPNSGYSLHIVLHNSVRQIMCRHFSLLFISKGLPGIQEEYLHLSAIDFTHVSEHIPVGKINLPWQAEGLQGTIERCCMMTLTVLNEAQHPLWCVGSPVKMSISKYQSEDLDYEGERFLMIYEDAEGKIKMTFVWMEELQEYFLVQLVLVFPLTKVNKQFRKEC